MVNFVLLEAFFGLYNGGGILFLKGVNFFNKGTDRVFFIQNGGENFGHKGGVLRPRGGAPSGFYIPLRGFSTTTDGGRFYPNRGSNPHDLVRVQSSRDSSQIIYKL